jgi:outer membrane protein assembly factor BamB
MTYRSGAFTLTLTLMFLFFSLNGTCGGTGEDKSAWPAWRGPNGDGISREANWDPGSLAVGPELLWRAKIGAGYSNVSINNDRLYTAGKSLRHVIYCLDAWTGEEIWRYEGGVNKEVQGTPTVDGRSVYSLFYNGDLLCLDSRNGELKWQRNIVEDYDVQIPFYGFAGPPVVVGDLLIITANTAGLAVDKNTGEKIWGSERPPGKVCEAVETLYTALANGTDYSAPVVYEYGGKHRVLISSWAGMHSVDAETGVVNWLFPWKIYSGGQVADPLCFDQMIFISENVSLGSTLLDISSGRPEVL